MICNKTFSVKAIRLQTIENAINSVKIIFHITTHIFRKSWYQSSTSLAIKNTNSFNIKFLIKRYLLQKKKKPKTYEL